MIPEQEFINYMNSIISKEDIEEYEENKKKLKRRLIIWLSIEAVIMFFLIVVLRMSIGIIAFFAIIVIISIVIIVQSCKTHWKNLKSKYASKIFEFLFKGYKYEYNASSYISESDFKSSVYNTSYTKYTGEDYLKVNIPNDDGTPSNVCFEISDLSITKEEEVRVTKTDRDGRRYTTTETRTYTVFSGILGFVKFPFKFKCDLSLNKGILGLEKIKLEDIDFNKKFTTRTDNQIEALCILTPTMINKLKEFSNRSGKFELTFQNKSLYLKMYKNIFELDTSAKQLTGKVFLRLYHDIADIISIVEEIKNNNKVFKM